MEEKRLKTFLSQHIHILVLAGALALSVTALVVAGRFGTSSLNAFGPTAQIYLSGMKYGLTTSTIILAIFLAAFLFLGSRFDISVSKIQYLFTALSPAKKNILVLIICLIFAFVSHAQNITGGYFNMDDFEIVGTNHSTTFLQSLVIPHGNDHTMPLFMAEMRAVDSIFGTNPIPYNLAIFVFFALIPFFTYLAMRRLGIGMTGFMIFLTVFTGATGWADMLTGFNIMSTYLQMILFFSIGTWAYISWSQTREKKYMIWFTAAAICAVAVDLPGIWVLPALLFLIICTHWGKSDNLRPEAGLIAFTKDVVRVNKIPLALLLGTGIVFALFAGTVFTIIQPHTFLSSLNGDGIANTENISGSWKILPVAKNIVSLFASGVSLPVLAPNIAKILTHPSIEKSIQSFWPFLEALVLVVNAMLFWFFIKRTDNKDRKIIAWLVATMLISILMVAAARPNHEPIPSFDYRYAGAAFYVYSIFLAMFAGLLVRKKGLRAFKIILPALVIVLAAQQAFGFQAVRLRDEAALRGEAITTLNKDLLSELDALSRENPPITIPNLSGAEIFQPMPGFTLSFYMLFFNRQSPIKLVQNVYMPPDNRTHTVTTVTSLRASTSPQFINALKDETAIRKYFLFPGLMSYKTIDDPGDPSKYASSSSAMTALKTNDKDITIMNGRIDPEKHHSVYLHITTDNVPGNLEFSFTFKNDFDLNGTAGKIRVDDYTPYILIDGRRSYNIETNLLQLFAYALSNSTSNVVIHAPTTKNASVSEAYLR